MTAASKVRRVWTRDEVLALQEAATTGVRYELIDGALLVSPSPNNPHQRCVTALIVLLYTYCKRDRVGWALVSPADISLDRKSILQPDIFVMPYDTPAPLQGWEHVTSLLLAVNVLSPSTQRDDRTVKRAFLQRMGVPLYWVVDYRNRRVEQWAPADPQATVLTETLTWQPDPTIEPLVVDLTELFDETMGMLSA